MTRQKANEMTRIATVPMQPGILEANKDVIIVGDVLYLQKIPMVHTISDLFKFRTIQRIIGKKANKRQLKKGIKQVIDIHKVRGLEVIQFCVDNEFECIRDDIHPTPMVVVGAGEHVGTVERSISTIKEGSRVYIYTHFRI